jgi:hypothetical protein
VNNHRAMIAKIAQALGHQAEAVGHPRN